MTKKTRTFKSSVLLIVLLPAAAPALAENAEAISMTHNLACGRVLSSTRQIATDTVIAGNICVADLDGDGLPDVLTPDYAGAPASAVKWHRNLGTGVFSASQFISADDYSLADGINPESIQIVDLDRDGDLDVLLASNFRNDKIVWYENLRGGLLWAGRDIAALDETSTTCVHAADIDGDGDRDVLTTFSTDESVAWYENQGSGAFSPRQVIATGQDRIFGAGVSDLDGDGDLDVLFTKYIGLGHSGQWGVKVVWYENLGMGSFSPQRDL